MIWLLVAVREQWQDGEARRRGGNERAVGQRVDAEEVQMEQSYESKEERVDAEAHVGIEGAKNEQSNGSGSVVVGFALRMVARFPVLCSLALQVVSVRLEVEPKMAICDASREYSGYMRVKRLTLSLLSGKAPSGRRLT